MTDWTHSKLASKDPINRQIWSGSLRLQRALPQRPPGAVGLLQQRLEGGPYPWVPDLVGRRASEKGGVLVLGSAYSPFISGEAGRERTLSLDQYADSTGPAAFQALFLRHVVRGDPSYYGPLAELCLAAGLELDQVTLSDLVRACFVDGAGGGGDAAVESDPEHFLELARLNWRWTWERMLASRSTCVVVLGTVAHNGLLHMLQEQGCAVTLRGQPRTRGTPARLLSRDPLGWKLGDWGERRTWWVVRWQQGGRARKWRVLPIYHPARRNKYDAGYQRSAAALASMLGKAPVPPERRPTRQSQPQSQPQARPPRPVSPRPQSAGDSAVIGMHFVCRGDMNVVDHGDGTFDTGVWKVSTRHCDGVEYIALHESKERRSYRHGEVLSWRTTRHEGQQRIIFTVRQSGPPRAWQGGGSGEKGYARAQQEPR